MANIKIPCLGWNQWRIIEQSFFLQLVFTDHRIVIAQCTIVIAQLRFQRASAVMNVESPHKTVCDLLLKCSPEIEEAPFLWFK